MKRCHSTNRRRRGFTLMEVLLVMAILIVLGSLVTYSFITIRKNAMEDAARVQIKALESACGQYQLHVGKMPTTLTDLRARPQGLANPDQWRGPYLQDDVPLDPWGGQYQYEVSTDSYGNLRPVISSNGSDGVKGTADDLSNLKKNNSATG